MRSQPLASVRVCQQGLTHFAKSTSKTDSLERILRIIRKSIRFSSLLQGKGEGSCSIQIGKTIEVLGVIQGFHLIEEFACPDNQGHYFIQTASLQKCIGKGFLFGYNFLSSLKLAEGLDLIHLHEVTRIAIGPCSLLRLATDISYLFYRFFVISEGIRTGKLWQVAISVSKIFTVTSALILKMVDTQAALIVLVLTSVSILTDASNLAKTEKWV